MPISLVDGDRLLDLLMEHDVGVTRRRVTVYELDEEAFSGEVETSEDETAPAEMAATIGRQPHHDGRARSLWPLPGGRLAWKGSLDQMLQYVASEAPTMAEAVAWMIQDFPTVSSDKVTRGYWQVPKSFGLVEADGERLTLTMEGAAYLKERSSRLLLEAATSNVLGFRELLDYLAERPHTPAEVLDRMRAELGVSWETDIQVGFRLGWLENMGIATAQGDAWTLQGESPPPDAASPPAEAKAKYTFDDHFADKPPAILDLFANLEERILALREGVERKFRKQYVAFRIGKWTICSVVPQKKRLRLFLPLDPQKIQHPIARDVTGVGHWGIGSLEVNYDSAHQLEQIMAWVGQAADEAGA
jgi:predicted transport protein